MRPLGNKIKTTDWDHDRPRNSNPGRARQREKQHCEDVRRMIPPILQNGLLDPWKPHPLEPGERICQGCLEDSVQLEVEIRPL